MSDDRLKEFREIKDKIREQDSIVDEVIDVKQENIEKEAMTISKLKKCKNNFSFQRKMIEDVSEDQVKGMSNGEYEALTGPILSTTASGELIADVLEESKQSGFQHDQHWAVCSSLDTTTGSGSSGYVELSNRVPGWFPNHVEITKVYQIEDETYQQIEYIRTELAREFPDISDDFDAFIKKYDAFKEDDTKYQDLIGSRSMFFLKLIFDFAEKNYGIKPKKNRLDDITKFVFGSNAPVGSFMYILKECKKIYSELSSQDPKGLSAKMGNVTPAYVDGLFKRLIGSIAAILNLRALNFKP